MKKITFTLIILTLFTFQIYAQLVSIPDPSFEAALIQEGVDNTDFMGFPDGFIDISEVSSVQYLSTTNYSITDLTGIEYFTSLISLDISNNGFSSSPLINVDLSNSSSLQSLICANSYITDIILGNNSNLETLNCKDNNLTSLDISGNLNLKFLNAENNNLTGLDLSQHILLQQVTLQNNQLSSLNVRNSTNNIITVFNASGNTNLTCIDVDNEADAITGNGSYANWVKDVSESYSNNYSVLNTEDYRIANLDFTIYPNPTTISFKVKSNLDIISIEIYNINGQKLKTYKPSPNDYDIRNLKKGIHFVKIINKKGEAIFKKIIKK